MATRPKLIVGVDPGTTAAFAALGLDRRLLRVWSRRDAGREEAVAALREAGDPAIVATDVAVPPEFVLRVASDFNARLFIPSHDMREAEKVHLSQGFKFSNLHERDAIACAVKAYNSVSNVLRKVERALAEKGLRERVDEAQALVLNGVRVDDAIGLFAAPLEADVEASGGELAGKGAARGSPKAEAEVARKNERIRELLVGNAELRKSCERLEAEKRELLKRIESLRRGALDRALVDSEVRKARAEAERARALSRALVAEVRKLKGAKTPLKRRDEKKSLDIEGIVAEYRERR